LADNRFTLAYIYGAVRAGTDDAFALVMPEVSTATMQIFLDRFAQTLAPDEHAAMILDQAGWHSAKSLVVPTNVTLVPLPPYAPQLNPVERIWHYLKDKFLSMRLHDDCDAIADAACLAWNKLTTEAGRLASLSGYPWIENVKTWMGLVLSASRRALDHTGHLSICSQSCAGGPV
jgi:hypothetical protein